MTSAHEIGLVGCRTCGTAHRSGESQCMVCTAKLSPVAIHSLQRTWAWLITAVGFYIPANTLPLLTNKVLAEEKAHTILEGVVIFYQHGDFFVATVILVASVIVPMLKLLAIGYIALSIQHGWDIAAMPRSFLYKSVELIGRWSMIDVFVVVLLVALVQLGAIASVQPSPGVVCFVFSVIFAMFAATSIDTRLIWANGHKKGLDNA